MSKKCNWVLAAAPITYRRPLQTARLPIEAACIKCLYKHVNLRDPRREPCQTHFNHCWLPRCRADDLTSPVHWRPAIASGPSIPRPCGLHFSRPVGLLPRDTEKFPRNRARDHVRRADHLPADLRRVFPACSFSTLSLSANPSTALVVWNISQILVPRSTGSDYPRILIRRRPHSDRAADLP